MNRLTSILNLKQFREEYLNHLIAVSPDVCTIYFVLCFVVLSLIKEFHRLNWKENFASFLLQTSMMQNFINIKQRDKEPWLTCYVIKLVFKSEMIQMQRTDVEKS